MPTAPSRYFIALSEHNSTFKTCTVSAEPARLPNFHTTVGGGGEKHEPSWYKENGESLLGCILGAWLHCVRPLINRQAQLVDKLCLKAPHCCRHRLQDRFNRHQSQHQGQDNHDSLRRGDHL